MPRAFTVEAMTELIGPGIRKTLLDELGVDRVAFFWLRNDELMVRFLYSGAFVELKVPLVLFEQDRYEEIEYCLLGWVNE